MVDLLTLWDYESRVMIWISKLDPLTKRSIDRVHDRSMFRRRSFLHLPEMAPVSDFRYSLLGLSAGCQLQPNPWIGTMLQGTPTILPKRNVGGL